MKRLHKLVIAAFITLLLFIPSLMAVSCYIHPMEDVTYNLFKLPEDGQEWEGADGWTVFTNEKGTVTELISDGMGGYSGLSFPGQTFYYSRRLTEKTDSAMLKIEAVNRTVSVFLDNVLIYTDCPELTNQIGYLELPMLEYDRMEPVTISLSPDYHGQTLTIAQSSPANSETLTDPGTVWPSGVTLYCGYAYESGLIASTVRTMLPAVLLFSLELFLLAAFILKASSGTISPELPVFALAVFLQMCSILSKAVFFLRYFQALPFDLAVFCFHASVGTLLLFLSLHAERLRPLFWVITVLQWISTLLSAVTQILLPYGDWYAFFVDLPRIAGIFTLLAILTAAFVLWNRGDSFFRHLAQTALLCIIGYSILLVISIWAAPDYVTSVFARIKTDITLFLPHFSLTLVWNLCLFSTLIAVVIQLLEQETERRSELQVLAAKNKMAMESYENLRCQTEEVQMLRHDMMKHYSLIHTMAVESPDRIPGYLDELIGQVENVRPVIVSKNQTLNILLNGKLNAANAKGISVEVFRCDAPKNLPLTDAELCCLVINILDNAIDSAAGSDTTEPYIKLDFHCKEHLFIFTCENSTPYKMSRKKKEPMPEHGYGLKIIRQIMNRWGDNMLFIDQSKTVYKITFVIPI